MALGLQLKVPQISQNFFNISTYMYYRLHVVNFQGFLNINFGIDKITLLQLLMVGYIEKVLSVEIQLCKCYVWFHKVVDSVSNFARISLDSEENFNAFVDLTNAAG